MTSKNVNPADAFRMIDALRDYADQLIRDGADSLSDHCRSTADKIENGQRIYPGNLIAVDQMDLDVAHSAIIGLMCARRDRAEELRGEAESLELAATRLEMLLEVF